jgi:hypothetical protein
MAFIKKGLDYYGMDLRERLSEIKRILGEKRLKATGLQKELVQRLMDAVRLDPNLNLDSDDWAWLYDAEDEITVEEEAKERKRILRIYNNTRDNFKTEKEFLDYEEEVEDIIFRLSTKDGVEEIEQKIKIYESENRNAIFINKSHQQEELKRREHEITLEAEEEKRKRQFEEENRLIREDKLLDAKEKMEVNMGERDASEVTVRERKLLQFSVNSLGANATAMQAHPLMVQNQPQPSDPEAAQHARRPRPPLTDRTKIRNRQIGGGYDRCLAAEKAAQHTVASLFAF